VLTNRISVVGMTVRELVAFGRYPYLGWNINLSDQDHLHIERAIDRVQIREIAEKEVSKLSDGQMQLVMIARSLAQDTPIILLDEPTAHLDLNNRVNIMRLLKSLCRESKKAILLATHELDLALQTADLVWLTGNNGNISSGVPEDLVLAGAFDSTFKFKRFDLKTGKVLHESYRGTTIYIDGSGSEYLWTRNALERSGLNVVGPGEEHKGSALRVRVVIEEDKPHWLLEKNNQLFKVDSIAGLIELV
jgi:iron complex transport system ATP-binding protein